LTTAYAAHTRHTVLGDTAFEKGEKSTIDYETDGFSLMLDKEQIKNKREIIGYLKKSIDHLKH